MENPATSQTSISLFQARILLIGLKFERDSGMKMTSKVNSFRLAANVLGYPKNKRPSYEVLIKGIEEGIAETEKL